VSKTYIVKGGNPLHGTVEVSGSKNAATKMMVASLLTSEPVRLKNVPRIGEVDFTVEMLRELGTQATWDSEESSFLHLTSPKIDTHKVSEMWSGKNRIPILFAAPLLHRLGYAEIPILGGDAIGARPIDFHISGYKALGATVEQKENVVIFKADKLKGASITLPYPSVMATENLLLASVLAEGRTVIKNVAVEPEIINLMDMLQKMGAMVFHEPGRVFVIEGVKTLSGVEHTIVPDRIEAASFASAAVATRGSVLVKGAIQNDMRTYLNYMKKVNGSFEVKEEGIWFSHVGNLKSTKIETGVHPGFMTDWQPPFSILLTQAEGTSVVHETVYEQRFGYLETLKKMEADIQLFSECLGGSECRFKERDCLHSALIKGPTVLKAADVDVPDIRAGFAYVIAALVAEGTSRITGAEKMERGYERLVEKLTSLGADIKVEEK